LREKFVQNVAGYHEQADKNSGGLKIRLPEYKNAIIYYFCFSLLPVIS